MPPRHHRFTVNLERLAKIGRHRARMHTETTLAPAAGSGIGRQIANELVADPEFVREMADVARRGLRAMHPRRWDPASKTWGEPEPDMKTQTATLFQLLAHMEGEPIKRIVHAHVGEGMPDPLEAVQDSPALLRAAQHLVNKAAFRTRKQTPKPAEMVIEE
jgi:hypothetical protein